MECLYNLQFNFTSVDVVFVHYSHLWTVVSSILLTFTQYVTGHTTDNKILDFFYGSTKEAYHPPLLLLLGRSGHNLVHLLSAYKPLKMD